MGKIYHLDINLTIGQFGTANGLNENDQNIKKTFRHITGNLAARSAFINLRLTLATTFLFICSIWSD